MRVNTAFTQTFLKELSISFLVISRLLDVALVILYLLMFKICGIIGISKIVFYNFSRAKRVDAYGFSKEALQLVLSYFSNKKQS